MIGERETERVCILQVAGPHLAQMLEGGTQTRWWPKLRNIKVNESVEMLCSAETTYWEQTSMHVTLEGATWSGRDVVYMMAWVIDSINKNFLNVTVLAHAQMLQDFNHSAHAFH
jgi:hypothetical protein